MTRITPVEPSLPVETATPKVPEKVLQQHFEQALLAPRVSEPQPLRPMPSALGRSFQKAHHAFAELLRGPENQTPKPRLADEMEEEQAAKQSHHEGMTPPLAAALQRLQEPAIDTLKPCVVAAEGCEHSSVRVNLEGHAQPSTAAQPRPQQSVIETLKTVGDAAEPAKHVKPEGDTQPFTVAQLRPQQPVIETLKTVVDAAEPAKHVKPEGDTQPLTAAQPRPQQPVIETLKTVVDAAEPAKHVKPEGDTQPLTAAQLPVREALKTGAATVAGGANSVDSQGTAGPVAPANDSSTQDDQPHDEPTRDTLPVDDQPDMFAPLMTPGDKLLARLQPTMAAPVLTRDLQQLLSTLQPHIQSAVTHTGSASVVQVHLPQLGHVEVQLVTIHGQLQIDIQASPGSLLQLQLARHELLERLQRISPEQPVHLSFSNAQDGDQRSRQRRSVYEEWEPQP